MLYTSVTVGRNDNCAPETSIVAVATCLFIWSAHCMVLSIPNYNVRHSSMQTCRDLRSARFTLKSSAILLLTVIRHHCSRCLRTLAHQAPAPVLTDVTMQPVSVVADQRRISTDSEISVASCSARTPRTTMATDTIVVNTGRSIATSERVMVRGLPSDSKKSPQPRWA